MARRGVVWAWALVAPLPSVVVAVAAAAFIGTSFHSADTGALVGFGLVGLVATKAWRMSPACMTAFLCGVGAVVAAGFGLVFYALTHMGPMG